MKTNLDLTNLPHDWREILGEELEQPFFQELNEFLETEYKNHIIYPNQEDIFNSFRYTPYSHVKVVILGQDPYHGPNQAHGLSFSVKQGAPLPPSLKNIYKELSADIGCDISNNGYLKKWADQGVLLLNTVLTVRHGEANSHKGKGWEVFTDKVINKLNEREAPIIFLLWGRPAQSKQKLINPAKHYIIHSAHPSPLSAHRGFFGSKPFSKINSLLEQMNQKGIDWEIEQA